MDRLDFPKIQRDALTVASVLEKSDEKSYWLSKTPYERLEALELMRQIIYGYDPSATRLVTPSEWWMRLTMCKST